MDITKVNEVFWHVYGPLPKGIFNNKKADNLVGEAYKIVSFKEAAKTWLATAVAIEASAQVEDNMINKEEGELDE